MRIQTGMSYSKMNTVEDITADRQGGSSWLTSVAAVVKSAVSGIKDHLEEIQEEEKKEEQEPEQEQEQKQELSPLFTNHENSSNSEIRNDLPSSSASSSSSTSSTNRNDAYTSIMNDTFEPQFNGPDPPEERLIERYITQIIPLLWKPGSIQLVVYTL